MAKECAPITDKLPLGDLPRNSVVLKTDHALYDLKRVKVP